MFVFEFRLVFDDSWREKESKFQGIEVSEIGDFLNFYLGCQKSRCNLREGRGNDILIYNGRKFENHCVNDELGIRNIRL